MAPRTAKTKKPTNTKVAENEAPKKGRGKATKTVEDLDAEVAEAEVGDVAPVIEKKNIKRGKKAANGDANGHEEANEVSEAPSSKKSKQNKIADAPSEEKEANDENVAEEEISNPDELEEEAESNGHSEEAAAGKTGKGRKKPTKKESAASKAKVETKTSGRGKKTAKQETESEVMEKEEESEDKPKAAAKGRGRKATKKADKEIEPEEALEEQNGSGEEEVKAEPPPAKGRKRAPAKPAKEATPEDDNEENVEEEELVKETKKKETKGKKTAGKKASAKQAETEEDEVMPVTKKRKFTQKDEKEEAKDEEPTEEAVVESKPAKGKRGAKKAVEAEDNPEAGDSGRRRRKPADEKVPSVDTKQKAPPKNKATTDYENIDFTNTSKNAQGKEWNLKIASWNVDGIRAWLNKGGLDYITYEKPDILCLQEIKCAKDKLPDELANLPGYHAYWQGSGKDGYAGVGIYTTKLAMNVQYGLQNEEFDNEGRIITVEYEQFYLINTYVPNAGRKLVTLPKRLQWNEEFRKHVKALNEKKPVIICGDMNVAHNEIDLANPKTNKKNAGFTAEEREGMTELLSDGFVDTFRHLKPDETGAYTFWTFMMNSRAKNVGWRLDYFLMSERLLPALCDNVIRSEVYGSDHCPITLFLHITSADKPKE